MRLESIVNAVFVIALIGTPIYMVLKPKVSAPVSPIVIPASGPTFATFCRSAHLVPKAVEDCDERMSAAKTDADRLQIERTFAMGNTKVNPP